MINVAAFYCIWRMEDLNENKENNKAYRKYNPYRVDRSKRYRIYGKRNRYNIVYL